MAGMDNKSMSMGAKASDVQRLEAGKSIEIGKSQKASYTFSKKLVMGKNTLVVSIIDESNKKVSAYTLSGKAKMLGMENMSGADNVISFHKKGGDYAMPINLNMAGQWEITVYVCSGTEKAAEFVIPIKVALK